MTKRFLVFGAHPDDPDIMFGGAALRLIAKGHKVKFVSVTDGSAGHHHLAPAELAAIRYQETQNVARLAGLTEYQVMPNPDGYLENTLENRCAITRIIREFQPDLVITHRLCDYHPDHRITAQLVLDTSFLLRVPHFCPDAPVPAKNPVFAYAYDQFTDPRPFRADAFLDITGDIDRKYQLMDCHKSQFYEWLPWVDLDLKDLDASDWDWEKRKAWLDEHWGGFFRDQGRIGKGVSAEYAETFEYCPYGKNVSPDAFRQLFQP